MSETPTTEEVRLDFSARSLLRGEAFDRWLAGVKREERERIIDSLAQNLTSFHYWDAERTHYVMPITHTREQARKLFLSFIEGENK